MRDSSKLKNPSLKSVAHRKEREQSLRCLNSGFEGRGVFLGRKTERSWRIGKRKK